MPKKRNKQPRMPWGVFCLASGLFCGSLGGLAIIAALSLESNGTHLPWQLPVDLRKKLGELDSSVLGLYGFVTAVGLFVAFGLIFRRKWAWVLYMLMTLIHLGINIYQGITRPDQAFFGTAVIEAFILGYMLLPGVRNCFQ